MKYSMIALVALFMFLPAQGQDSSGKEFNLLIGTYTEPGKGDGIYVHRFNSERGEFSYRAAAARSLFSNGTGAQDC